MMKAIILSLALTTTAIMSVTAQNLIAVQNGGTPKFYSILQDAITNAQNKDTIFIPGGAYSFTDSKITIDKELHLIGAGHVPDSTSATGITQLNASVYLINGANNSSFEGFYLNGRFYAGTTSSGADVDNIIISRCNCNGIYLNQFSQNWTIIENVVRESIYGTISSSFYTQNNLFSNNIIIGGIIDFSPNNIFRNNLFILNSSHMFHYVDGCIFQNNIFTYASVYGNLSSCIFDNNLFFPSFNIPYSCIGNNNIENQSSATTFVNQSGSTFSYEQDYHLKPTSPGKNAGKDGTDIGIYGGAFPWKEGSIPSNPHFQTVKIDPKTDASGKLNVSIKVSAQDN